MKGQRHVIKEELMNQTLTMGDFTNLTLDTLILLGNSTCFHISLHLTVYKYSCFTVVHLLFILLNFFFPLSYDPCFN